MRRYYYKKVILFSIVWVVILTFYSSASAFSAACDSCLASCQGDPLCCTGIGCYCEDECSTGNCPPDQTEKWYCTLSGICWVVGCECKTLGTPSLVNPAAGLTGVSISPTLDWSDASNARSYDVRVCSDSACSSVAASSNVSVSQWQVSTVLNTSTTYWWQVRAINSCDQGSWSAARSFTTICSSPSPPGTPSLLSPANGLTNVLINTTLDWSDVACASTYDVRVCSNSACSSVAASSNVSVSQWQVSPVLNVSTTYWWQVRANNSYGNGAWSTARSFTTSSDIPLSNGIPVNGIITGSASGNAWKYYYSDIPSGATNLVVDLYNLSADADLYVRYGSKPSFSTYNCRPYQTGILSEQCTTPSPLSGQLWIGINNYDTGTIAYTVKVTWDDPVFTDVPSGYWAEEYITAIYNAGITTGCVQDDPITPWNERQYCPEDNVTRGQMAAFIIRAKYGESFIYTLTPYFTDVPITHGFFKYVQKLKDDGITAVSGIYGVDNEVTREQMAAFLVRAVEGEPPVNYCASGDPFPDVVSNMWSCDYIKRLKELGITTGYGDGTYGPYDLVTRGQMAAFLSRAFLGMQ